MQLEHAGVEDDVEDATYRLFEVLEEVRLGLEAALELTRTVELTLAVEERMLREAGGTVAVVHYYWRSCDYV